MTNYEAAMMVMANAGITGTAIDGTCYRQLTAALNYCCQRLLLPELLVSRYQVTSTTDGQVNFAIPSTLQNFLEGSFKWVKNEIEYPLDWRQAVDNVERFPYCVWREGSNFKVNPNEELAGGILQFDYYSKPSLGVPTADFPYPHLEDYCINLASSKVLAMTDSAKAATFATIARSLWTGISAANVQ